MIVAITVTYNSSNTLVLTVQALMKQSFEIDKLIIVDNASSDEHYNQILRIAEKNDRIVVLRLKRNTGGGAGGNFMQE